MSAAVGRFAEGAEHGSGRGGISNGSISNGSDECCWCPVCQLIATLRGDRPELTERLAETQAAVSGLLRALADAVSGPAPAARPESARVQRIDLERESD